MSDETDMIAFEIYCRKARSSQGCPFTQNLVISEIVVICIRRCHIRPLQTHRYVHHLGAINMTFFITLTN